MSTTRRRGSRYSDIQYVRVPQHAPWPWGFLRQHNEEATYLISHMAATHLSLTMRLDGVKRMRARMCLRSCVTLGVRNYMYLYRERVYI